VLGALLQNRMVTALHAQATHYAGQLPPQVRGPFVASFNAAARNGLEVGRDQTGGTLHLPSGIPATVVAQVQRMAEAVFTHSFADAMRPTLVLPLALILLAALSCVAVRSSALPRPAAEREPEPRIEHEVAS
jgi:hypothetical protein